MTWDRATAMPLWLKKDTELCNCPKALMDQDQECHDRHIALNRHPKRVEEPTRKRIKRKR
jgi:hypothetical protein